MRSSMPSTPLISEWEEHSARTVVHVDPSVGPYVSFEHNIFKNGNKLWGLNTIQFPDFTVKMMHLVYFSDYENYTYSL